MLTKSQLDLARWKQRPADYFAECLQIQDKASGKNKPFALNAHQKKIQDAIDKQRRAGKPVRVITLKPRQTGISTHSTANIFHGMRFGASPAMIVSKDMDSSEHIFSMAQRFMHYLPSSEKALLKTQASNRKEIRLEEPHGGRLIVETAGKTSAGHSFTVRSLILSEVSRWPEGCEDTIVGLLAAVPYEPDTTVIIESVANGMAGWFWQEWYKKDSDYEKIFLPWFEHMGYTKPLPIDAVQYERKLSQEERQLQSQFNLTLEQIEWRRWALHNTCQDNLDKFHEQYPATAREAFIASGNTFFHLATLEGIVTSEPVLGELRQRDGDLLFFPLERGQLAIWRKPQRNRHYVIGADVAEGLEIDGAPGDDRHDYSSADVLDRDTGEQAAQLHGHITPGEFGRQLDQLGRYYNNAFIGVESNAGYGLHVLDELQRLDYPAHLLYRRQMLDELTKRPTTKLGWRTTQSNRKSMMAALDTSLRAKNVLPNSEETVGELRAFVTKPNGRIEAGSGQKDDRVFSLAIANMMLAAAPPVELEKNKASDYQPTKYLHTPLIRTYAHA